MTLSLILFGSLLSWLLGQYLLAAQLQWQQQSRLRRWLFYILFGLQAVLCTLGLLGLVDPLECLPTIYYSPQSIQWV
jgi:predicted membrane channel-forming protein YqfA (hemolysin III family)